MGVLRNTIKVFFNEQNVEQVMRALLEGGNPDTFPISLIEKVRFSAAYTNVSQSNTEDQARSAYEIAQSRWFGKSLDSNLTFCSQNNIFNVLLHFASQVLYERDNEPVCKFEHLLKWHEVTSLIGEDILTTSYFASYDIGSRTNRKCFSWPAVVNHDNASLHRLYSQRMADVHNHLQGTGFIAELNWMSLMNDITSRRRAFYNKKMEVSKAYRTNYANEYSLSSLYMNVIKAAAIRVYLFSTIICGIPLLSYDLLKRILAVNSAVEIDMYLNEITACIETAKLMYGNTYQTVGMNKYVIDYTIESNADFQKANPCSNINFLLSGERSLLYRVLQKIYRGDGDVQQVSMLLYTYLLVKNNFRQELVQTNKTVGFANFQDYQDRKKNFLKSKSIYEKLLVQSAIKSTVHDLNTRYIETRIYPPEKIKELKNALRNYDKNAVCLSASGDMNLFDRHKDVGCWHYVMHFIKNEDVDKQDGAVQKPRNWNVRTMIKLQSFTINHIRQYNYEEAKRIVGIDAASSEINCRPEVFAQAYRYLRGCKSSTFYDGKKLKDLGITYHVGEDYNDIIDGLRSIREATMFLQLRNGDRIGHGLVLGTDVNQYYKKRSYAIPMSKQCILDNMAFMLVEGHELKGFDLIYTWLIDNYNKYFKYIFGPKIDNREISYLTYYKSWLLRGDSPECYVEFGEKPTDLFHSFTTWDQNSLVLSSLQNDAREYKEARCLYHLYHYNNHIKQRGNEYDQIYYPKEAMSVISQLQEKILTEIETKQIAIECNPSSNFKIGEIEKFIEHPITRFNMIQKPENGRMHNLVVSVNTDDKGVFSTSLEREYALIAAAYDKEYQHDSRNNPTPREVYEWLDSIRKMSLDMAFYKSSE